MHVTLDGFVAGLKGEMDWIKFDDKMFDFVKTFTDNADTGLYGRTTWKMMDSYWPSAADKPNATRHDKDHSLWYNSIDKIVLSNTMTGQNAGKTIFIGGDIIQQVKGLKQKNGKDILIFGSPSASNSILNKGLVDEFWIFVNPILLGQGIPLFKDISERVKLSLIGFL